MEKNKQAQLNLEKLKNLVYEITEAFLAEGKRIIYPHEILETLKKKRGLDLANPTFELSETDKINIEEEIRNITLNCATEALKTIQNADSVYDENLAFRRDFLEMLILFAKYGGIANISNLFIDLRSFFNPEDVNYINTLCNIYFTNFNPEEEMVRMKVSDLLEQKGVDQNFLEEDLIEEESPLDVLLRIIEESLAKGRSRVSLPIIKKRLRENGFSFDEYSKEDLICLLNDLACGVIDGMIYEDEELADRYECYDLEDISERCFNNLNPNNPDCKLMYLVYLRTLCFIGWNKTLDTYLFAKPRIKLSEAEAILFDLLEDELSKR